MDLCGRVVGVVDVEIGSSQAVRTINHNAGKSEVTGHVNSVHLIETFHSNRGILRCDRQIGTA